MQPLTHIANVQLLGPARVGVQLASDDDLLLSSPIVIGPNDFITDFSTFLTALRAMAETRPVDHESLRQSWRQQREVLRSKLVEEDPWAVKEETCVVRGDESTDEWSRLLCEPAPEHVAEPAHVSS